MSRKIPVPDGTIMRDTFDIELCGKLNHCRVQFEFFPAVPLSEETDYVPAKILIEKIELVEIRKAHFGHKGAKNKDVLAKLDIIDWVSHDVIGKLLMDNLDIYTKACHG